MPLAARIAPQPIVLCDLVFGEELAHLEVSAQVGGAEFGPGQGYAVEGALETVVVDPSIGEEAIQLALLLHEPLPELDRMGLHTLEEGLSLRPLLRGQGELVSEFEDMEWTRVVVQLRHLCEAHALAVQEAPDLGLREGLDRPRLLAGVGLWGLMLVLLGREGGGGAKDESEGQNSTHSKMSSIRGWRRPAGQFFAAAEAGRWRRYIIPPARGGSCALCGR